MFLIVDFGSQSTHLISRRIRELGIKNTIITPDEFEKINLNEVKGIILSGGPSSVYEPGAPTIDGKLFKTSVPILGICYGLQIIAYKLDGKVTPGKKKEYGPANITIQGDSPLFAHIPQTCNVWMSHGDEVSKIPAGFAAIAKSDTIPHAAIANEGKKWYGIQFHPELVHTQFGDVLLSNFIKICGIEPVKQELTKHTVTDMIEDIKESVGTGKAICALSGGVDSSVAALLVHKAIGKHLTAIYIDSGLMRQNETEQLREVFKNHYHMNVKILNAKQQFLKALKGVTDPEKKRKAIGKTFITIFEKEAKKTGATFLVQGTIYPDVIESAGTKHASKIKSHHNVGGLPDRMKLSLIEPLRMFYKDEVRKVASLLEMPTEIVNRRPFPGPGLAIRIIGEVSEKKLAILRKSDAIVKDEIKKAGLELKLWQAFAIFTGIKTTGVRGDARAYGETIAIRAIEAADAMSAHWANIPYDVLNAISVRIVTEVPEVTRVVYDISNKPPATMEWE